MSNDLSLTFDNLTDAEMVVSVKGGTLAAPVEIWRGEQSGGGFAAFLLAQADRIAALEAQVAAAPDALGAEWMRREAWKLALLYQTRQAEGDRYPDTLQGWAFAVDDIVSGILAIPGPTPADLLAEALKLPEIAALVEAVRKFNGRVVSGEVRSTKTFNEFCAALAALPKGGA